MAERSQERRTTPQASGWALVCALFGALCAGVGTPSCLDARRSPAADAEPRRCASCHGDPRRAGDDLLRAAPPFDLLGRSSTRNPGVGAHAVHLNASATHAAVACQECHVVPDTVDAAGHADDARPAELHFGRLAQHGGHAPGYDAKARSCRDSYCHGQAEPRWTEPRSSSEACGSCHGLPPAAPHPQSERCFACHADVIDEQRSFVAPALHVDGKVQYSAGGCEQCHGSKANAAPPSDLQGGTDLATWGVGAHQVHLLGGSAGRPLACAECHRVPEKLEEPTHADAPPAEVMLLGAAQARGRNPTWNRQSASCTDTYCHAPTPGDTRQAPAWLSPGESTCQSCHGTPPPAPHPQIEACSQCHAAVVGKDNHTIVDRLRHVDGHVDVSFDTGCSSCHGNETSPAPPRDLLGNSLSSSAGVGAHRAHLSGSARARAVPCESCHRVPKHVLETGHVDTPLPAEVIFSGAALGASAKPEYAAGSCRNSSCHGASFPEGRPSGGSNTAPRWTGGPAEAACGSCHGLPPPPPHPLATYPCHACHGDVAEDDVSFLHPELHVDGVVTFRLP